MQGRSSIDRVPQVATTLGRLGLLPFIAAPVLLHLDPHHTTVYSTLLASYALAIICFLVGVWWGLALIRRAPAPLIYSNAIVVAAFFGQVLLTNHAFFLLCALLYPMTVVVERSHTLFRPQPPYYARLRLQLTVVATVSLLLSAALT